MPDPDGSFFDRDRYDRYTLSEHYAGIDARRIVGYNGYIHLKSGMRERKGEKT